MATILYLDVDDEITSAAARIRSASETKVGLVLPAGSRLATSRINFRLLAREGLERNRVLSIVAADPAARAIAASAGLPVYASVAEFEEAIAPTAPSPPEPAPEPPGEATTRRPSRRRAKAAGAAAAAAAGGDGGTAAGDGATTGPAPAEQLSAELVPPVVPAATIRASVSSAQAAPSRAPTPPPKTPPVVSPSSPETRARSSAATIPVVPALRTGGGFSNRLLVALGIVLVAVLVLAVVGYTVLPSATVVVTPAAVPVGPVDFVVRADPDASSVDPVGGVIPATRLSKDFTASGEFDATGERIVQAKARGTLRWRNCDPTKAYTIPTATVAQTGTGIGFETLSAVFLPVATLSGGGSNPTLTCSARDVSSRALKPGPGGNVGAGTVNVVPSIYNSVVIKVTNPAAMTGGKRDVFTKIQQSDIDAALATLAKDLNAQFTAWVNAPEELPPGATVYPATGKLGTAVPSVDPTSLVDVEQATFQLSATATGTVVAVDPSPVQQVAATRISASVPAEHRLKDGSVTSSHDNGHPDGEVVDFRVTASGSAIPVLDPAALREQIKGKSVDEAKRILGRYGAVTVTTWPGFVSSIPTLDARLDLTVAGATEAPGPSPGTTEPSPGPSGSAP